MVCKTTYEEEKKVNNWCDDNNWILNDRTQVIENNDDVLGAPLHNIVEREEVVVSLCENGFNCGEVLLNPLDVVGGAAIVHNNDGALSWSPAGGFDG